MVDQVKDNDPRNQYTATSGQTIFPYTFAIFDKGDLVVIQEGVTLAEGTNYTVSGVGDEDGGNVTLLVGATTGDTITIYRDMAFERLIDYQNNGDFLASDVNDDYDRLWLATQQNKSEIARCLDFSQDDEIASTRIGSLNTRANKLLAFDASGELTYQASTTLSPVADSLVDTVAAAKALNLAIGDYVRTGGYASFNDGGGALYRVVPPTGTDDGGSYHDMSNGLQLEQIFGDVIRVDTFGTIADGVTDDYTAINNALLYAQSITSINEIIIPTVEFGSAKNYGIDGRLHFINVNVNGNGCQFTPLNATSGIKISGTRMTHKDYRVIYSSQQSATTAEAIIYGDTARQCSKNTFIEINTRNAYRGAVCKTSNLTLFGNVWINCRCDNSWDWQWYMQMKTGSTSNTFVNCQARGFLAGDPSSSPKGFYGENSNEFIFVGGFAVDQARDGEGIQILNALTTYIDVLLIESCEIKSDLGYLARFGTESLVIGRVITKTTLRDPGVGNTSYDLQIDSSTVNADIGIHSDTSPQAGATGTNYTLRTNNTTRVKTANIPLSATQTSGNQELFLDLGRIKGLANSDPSVSFTKTYEAGDIALNRSVSAGEPIGWVCTVAGTPGTWVPFGAIQSANTYTPTNVTTDRAFDADTVAIAELADVVGTLIADLQSSGVLK